MFLDLTTVLRVPGHTAEREINLVPQVVDDVELTENTTGVVRGTNARRNIVVSGKAHTAVKLQCARCLSNYSQPMDLELDAVVPMSFFRTLVPTTLPEPDEADAEVADVEMAALFDENSLDVRELLRQAIVLQSPIAPRCSDDCTGLPEAENYVDDGVDQRLSALKDWEKKYNGSS